MQHDHPGTQLHHAHATSPDGLPALALPPVPFARSRASIDHASSPAAAQPDVAPPQPAAAHAQPLPSGTAVRDLLGALELDGVEPVDARSMLDDFDDVRLDVDIDALLAAPMVGEPGADTAVQPPLRPHHEFSIDVERRSRRERRHAERPTPDRRAFTSTHMAAPTSGPADPRPVQPPPVRDGDARPHRIDPVMPPLPIDPAPVAIAPATPFPVRLDDPPAPLDAPAPPMPAPAPTHVTSPGIESIFSAAAQPYGAAAPQAPMAGPAGPATAPGQQLAPIAASVAATPSAWYGGNVQVDDAMMVWSAPGTELPLTAEVAAAIAPRSGVAPASGIATTTLSPDAPATPVAARRAASPLRLALLVGLPAAAGISIAIAIDRFLL